VNARFRTPSTSSRRELPLAAAILILALSGCATERGIALPEMNDWQTRQAILAGLDDWSFSGRIGVKSTDDGFNGRLRWRQQADDFDASLSGPLGAGAVRIEGSSRGLTVYDGEGIVTELDDPERDLKLRYGWTIPVESLRYWVLGVPDPRQPADVDFGEDGQVSRLVQGGWTAEISQYREGGGQLMPRRITAENGDSRVRLVIDSWVFY